MAAWVVLSWVAPEVHDERSFLHLGAALLGLVMVSSAFLFWQEIRAGRQELRAIRRESRNIPPWRRVASGPLKRGCTPPPLASPSSSRGTCCQPCSCPEQAACRILHSVSTPRSYASRVSYA